MPRLPRYEQRVGPQVGSAGRVQSTAETVSGIGRIASAQMGQAADAFAGGADAAELQAKLAAAERDKALRMEMSAAELQAKLAAQERDKALRMEVSAATANYGLFEQDLANRLAANKGANAAQNLAIYDELAKKKMEEALGAVSLPEAREQTRRMLEQSYISRRGSVQAHQIQETENSALYTSNSAIDDIVNDGTYDEQVFSNNVGRLTMEAENIAVRQGLDPAAARTAAGRKYAKARLNEALQLKDPVLLDMLDKSPALSGFYDQADRIRMKQALGVTLASAQEDFAITQAMQDAVRPEGFSAGMIDPLKAKALALERLGPTKAKDIESRLMSAIDTHNAKMSSETLQRERGVRDYMLSASHTEKVGDASILRPVEGDALLNYVAMIREDYADNPEMQKQVVDDAVSQFTEWNAKAASDVKNRKVADLDRIQAQMADLTRDSNVRRGEVLNIIKANPDPETRADLMKSFQDPKAWAFADDPNRIAQSALTRNGLLVDLRNIQSAGGSIYDALAEKKPDGTDNPLYVRFSNLLYQDRATIEKVSSTNQITLEPGYAHLNSAVMKRASSNLKQGDRPDAEAVSLMNQAVLNYALITGADVGALKDEKVADAFVQQFMDQGGVKQIEKGLKLNDKRQSNLLTKPEVTNRIAQSATNPRTYIPTQMMAIPPAARSYIKQSDISDDLQEYLSLFAKQFNDMDQYEVYMAGLMAEQSRKGKDSRLAKMDQEIADLVPKLTARQKAAELAMKEAASAAAAEEATRKRNIELQKEWAAMTPEQQAFAQMTGEIAKYGGTVIPPKPKGKAAEKPGGWKPEWWALTQQERDYIILTGGQGKYRQ